MNTCDICGELSDCSPHDEENICEECFDSLDELEPDFHEPEIDYYACDRESAEINSFCLQERY